MHRAFNQAVRWNYLARNACDLVEKPKAKNKDIQHYDEDEATKFLEAAKADTYYALYVLAIMTGLRQGELFGLRWEDIDWKGSAIAVRRTVDNIKGKHKIENPKTEKGRRRVNLPKFALAALREHRKRTLSEGVSSVWVFSDSQGGLIRRYNFVRRSFYPIMERAKLRRIRFHDLRHTAATLLLLQGVHPKVVQERLGHATIGITLDTYSHVLPSLQQEAADKLDELFGDATAVGEEN